MAVHINGKGDILLRLKLNSPDELEQFIQSPSAPPETNTYSKDAK